jgi:hypothetical protein
LKSTIVSAESENYRQRAAVERDAAAKESLSTRRELHLRSAEVWERLAQTIEETEAKASVNLAVRVAQKEKIPHIEQLEHQHHDQQGHIDDDHSLEVVGNDTNNNPQEKSQPVSSTKIRTQTIISSPYRILHRYTLPFLYERSPRFASNLPVQSTGIRKIRR